MKAFAVQYRDNDTNPWKVIDHNNIVVESYDNRKNANQSAKRLNASYEAKMPKPLNYDQAVAFMTRLGFRESTITQFMTDTGAKSNVASIDEYAVSNMTRFDGIKAATRRFVCKIEGNGKVAIRAWWF